MKRILPFFLLLSVSSSLLADVIILDDGTRLEGAAQKTEDGWTITDSSGKQTSVSNDQVSSFEMSPHGTSESPPDQLADLRRSVENMSDLDRIIDRYRQFINANPNTPAAADAQADLAVWTQRQAQGEIKFGDKWMTQAEHKKILADEIPAAVNVRNLLVAGNAHAATDAMQQALAQDPDDAPVLYLQAGELVDQNISAARADLETANGQVPDHAPTLNNIAVILFRQHSGPTGLTFYLHAMQAKPVDRKILDNVAEALNVLTPDQSKIEVARRVSALFNQQDADLAKIMEKQGLYRWGATWVSKDVHDACVAADTAAQAKRDAIKKHFDQLQSQIDSDNNQIGTDRNNMKRAYTGSGANTQILYPGLMQHYEGQISHLQGEISDLQNRQATLRTQAAQIQADYPSPKYTGVQQLFGPQDAPLLDDQPAGPNAAT